MSDSEMKIPWAERARRLGCAVVIPTYNNDRTLGGVIAGVRRYCADIFVVNDGSTDRTAEVLASTEGIRTIAYARNRGKGYALRCGLRAAREAGFRYALTIDSDGQHYPDDIARFIERIERRPDTLLIGARNLTADNMPARNTFANRFSNFWYLVETGRRLEDTQSGFRLYPLRRLGRLRSLCSRYEFEVEVIVRAAWRGVEVENIPVRVYYAPDGERVSHFRPLRDFTRISLLNSVLVLEALLFYYPWRFFRALTRENIRRFIRRNITRSPESNARLAAAMGWGVLCGILPIWGYQMIFAGLSAHFMRLNKLVAIVFSNISIPPMIPFILYGSYWLGGRITGLPVELTLAEVTLRRMAECLAQYLAGSVALAVAAGAAVWAVSWCVMTLMKRTPCHE
jgi:glycosyltransferase involved in cell wall biosynthesis